MNNPYEELVGGAWPSLATGVRLAHSPPLEATGVMRIRRGPSRLLKFVDLPPPGEQVQTTLIVTQTEKGVVWTRVFDGARAVSTHEIRGAEIHERAGPFRLAMRMVVEGDSIWHHHIGTWFLGIPIPKSFGPQVRGHVSPGSDEKSWRDDVRIWHSLLGPISHYEGEMHTK